MILTTPTLSAESIVTAGDEQNHASHVRPPKFLKGSLVFVFLAGTVLSQIGYNIGSYFVSPSLIGIYMVAAVVVASGRARVNMHSAVLFSLFAVFGAISFLMNKDDASFSSLILLLALYLPFVITLTPKVDVQALWTWALRAFSNVALFVAVAGIAQFFAQTVIHADWLFDFKTLLPPAFRQQGEFNTVIHFGSFIKSNGFFLAEPSGLSGLAAMGIIIELSLFKRYIRLALFVFALLVSYSGSGILTLLIFSLFPLGGKTVLRVGLLAASAAIILFLFGDTLNLWQTVERVNEFSSEGSSGYARFVAPLRLLYDLFASDAWTPFVGHGPGMMMRTMRNYSFHDPTYAKLLFEYGAVGFAAVVALVADACRRSPAPVQLKAVMFFSWLIGGGALLSTPGVSIMYVFLAMWPSMTALKLSGHKTPLIRVASKVVI